MSAYSDLRDSLRTRPLRWLITGGAGFIGSHLAATLIELGQQVRILDNMATGTERNLDWLKSLGSFEFVRGSVADLEMCRTVCGGVDAVLHEAGFISVPLSVEDPLACHSTNVTGTLNLLIAAREAGVRRFVYASSSAVYGDDPAPAKREEVLGMVLSPYGASKLFDEYYARLFTALHGFPTFGLRYFNVFGPRQNPKGGYAAVIPQWITRQLDGLECHVHGDGSQTRDFCHIGNVVQANLLAGAAESCGQPGGVYNIALGGATSLVELHAAISRHVATIAPGRGNLPPRFGPPRMGDIIHSSADIGKSLAELRYSPEIGVDDGLRETVAWYAEHRGELDL
jgi:UDP-N-acetylglucosamine 4-epimerase